MTLKPVFSKLGCICANFNYMYSIFVGYWLEDKKALGDVYNQ